MQNIIVPDKYRQTFDTLVNGHNTAHDYSVLSLWPEWAPNQIVSESAREFWKMSDLLVTADKINAEPYKSTITLDNIIREYTPNKLKEKNPELMSKMAEKHFRVIDDKNFDAELSRFATWALFKEIGKRARTIFHQEYIMSPSNYSLVDIYKQTKQVVRINLREDVRKYQKQLNGIMKKLHAHDKHYAELNREMIKWLFGNVNSGDIRYEYKLPEGKALADFMNAYLLAAYGTALKNIVGTWDNEAPVHEYGILRGIIYNEMIATRQDMQKKFGAPETAFDRTSVDEVAAWHNKREFEFAKNYINKYVR